MTRDLDSLYTTLRASGESNRFGRFGAGAAPFSLRRAPTAVRGALAAAGPFGFAQPAVDRCQAAFGRAREAHLALGELGQRHHVAVDRIWGNLDRPDRHLVDGEAQRRVARIDRAPADRVQAADQPLDLAEIVAQRQKNHLPHRHAIGRQQSGITHTNLVQSLGDQGDKAFARRALHDRAGAHAAQFVAKGVDQGRAGQPEAHVALTQILQHEQMPGITGHVARIDLGPIGAGPAGTEPIPVVIERANFGVDHLVAVA
jgi:hypothetical protein